VQLLENAIYPPNEAPRVGGVEVDPSTIGFSQVGRFLNVSANEYQRAIGANDQNEPINLFRNVLAKTWSDHRVAINLDREQSPLVFCLTFDGTDVVNHLFAPYHPPYRDGISQDKYRKYWPAVANYYAEVDRLLGEW